MIKNANVDGNASPGPNNAAARPSLPAKPASFNQECQADCGGDKNRLKQKQLNLSPQTQSITNYQAIIRVLGSCSHRPPASLSGANPPISSLHPSALPVLPSLNSTEPAQTLLEDNLGTSLPATSPLQHVQQPSAAFSGSKLEQTRNRGSISNQSVPGEKSTPNPGVQSQNELHQSDEASQSNPLASSSLIEKSAENDGLGGRADLRAAFNGTTDAPTENHLLDRPNCGVFSNGPTAKRLAEPAGGAGKLPRDEPHHQKNLLCGTKRLFNQTDEPTSGAEFLPLVSPLDDGYLKSPFKSRGREVVKATAITKKQAAFLKTVPTVQMARKRSFEPLSDSARLEQADQSQNLVLVHFKTEVAGRLVQDSFLWPKEEQDLLQIKFFAANLLADVFGRQFGALDPREIEFFTSNVAYVVLRELDLLKHPDLSLRHLAQDGLFGNNLELRPGTVAEHVVTIDLNVRVGAHLRLQESFEWDLSNPDNSPEEFSALLVADYLHSERHLTMMQIPASDVALLEKAVSLEVRRKIDLQVMAQARQLKCGLEALSTKTGSSATSTATALQKRSRPEIHFTGQRLTVGLDRNDQPRQIKSIDEVPNFLRFEDERMELRSENDLDSAASTSMYAEMTLKNARFQPQFPVKPVQAPPAQPKINHVQSKRVKEVDIECLQPRSVNLRQTPVRLEQEVQEDGEDAAYRQNVAEMEIDQEEHAHEEPQVLMEVETVDAATLQQEEAAATQNGPQNSIGEVAQVGGIKQLEVKSVMKQKESPENISTKLSNGTCNGGGGGVSGTNGGVNEESLNSYIGNGLKARQNGTAISAKQEAGCGAESAPASEVSAVNGAKLLNGGMAPITENGGYGLRPHQAPKQNNTSSLQQRN